jgi:uncharacterized protein YciI
MTVGMLMKPIIRLWLVESKSVVEREVLMSKLEEHLAYQQHLERSGVLFAAGPLFDGDGRPTSRGLIFLQVESEAAARRHADEDPFHRLGIRVYELFQWSANEGNIRTLLR